VTVSLSDVAIAKAVYHVPVGTRCNVHTNSANSRKHYALISSPDNLFVAAPPSSIAPRSRFLPNDNLKIKFHTPTPPNYLPTNITTEIPLNMDPLDNMAGAPVPKNFDAENAQNNEDVRLDPATT
jgi:hypothetical protein